MYFGRRITLLRVCDGSRQTRILPGLLGVAILSRITILDIHSVGSDTVTNCPVAS
jgi:hypothetical protein